MTEKGNLVTRTGRLAATGVLGVVIVDGLRAAARRGTLREGAVGLTAMVLRGKRRAEVGAENVRLAGGDVVAEARARNGEQAPAPGADVGGAAGAAGHDHDH